MDTASLAEPTTGNHRNTAPMVRRVPACSLPAAICLRNSLGRRKAILLQPHSSLRPKAMLTITTNATSSGWGTRQNISPRQPASHHPISRLEYTAACACYDLRFRSGAAIRTMNTTSWIYVANWPIPRRKVWDILLQARARWKTSVMSAVSTVSARTAETFHTAEAVWSLSEGEVLATVPDNEEGDCHRLNLSSCRSSG